MKKPTINNDLIDKLAGQAHLEFTDSEKKTIRDDLEKMVMFVKKLDDLDTTDIEPLIYPNREKGTLRKDVVQQSLDQNEVLRNVPSQKNKHIKVPLFVNKNK